MGLVVPVDNLTEMCNSALLLLHLLAMHCHFSQEIKNYYSNCYISSVEASKVNPVDDVVIPPCTLSQDMKYLFNNKEYSDVTFVIEEQPIYAWKGVQQYVYESSSSSLVVVVVVENNKQTTQGDGGSGQ